MWRIVGITGVLLQFVGSGRDFVPCWWCAGNNLVDYVCFVSGDLTDGLGVHTILLYWSKEGVRGSYLCFIC